MAEPTASFVHAVWLSHVAALIAGTLIAPVAMATSSFTSARIAFLSACLVAAAAVFAMATVSLRFPDLTDAERARLPVSTVLRTRSPFAEPRLTPNERADLALRCFIYVCFVSLYSAVISESVPGIAMVLLLSAGFLWQSTPER